MVQIKGVVERVTFRNEENLYTVARFDHNSGELCTIVGNFASIHVGETLRLSGEWATHKEYGLQFRVDSYELAAPATVGGIEKYLGSGLIKGIGPVTAEKLVSHFGLTTLDVIEKTPERLQEVEGIGPKKAETIARGFEAQKDIQEIMLFLQSHDVTSGLAVKIYKQYGKESIRIVKEQPYRLAADVYGIGFKTADQIASRLGVEKDAPQRLAAGLKYCLGQAVGEGHMFLPRGEILQRSAEVLEVNSSVLEEILDSELSAGEIVEELIPRFGGLDRSVGEEDLRGTAIYLRPFYLAEKSAAERLVRLVQYPQSAELALGWKQEWIGQCEAQSGISLAPGQRQAVTSALDEQVLVITGGPGTGKTTIVKVILQILERQGKKSLLAAPTGRAAKRMTEATGVEAKTIHRLLEFGFADGEGMKFQRTDEQPLDADTVIVDEASMLDTLLFNHLVKAIRPGTRLILVGDVDQLPPVGAGNVLNDLIESQIVSVARLNEVYRQAAASLIVTNAHRINQGVLPQWNQPNGDFFWIDEEDSESISQTIRDLVVDRLPSYYQLNAKNDIQVLTPTRRSVIGTHWLNRVLQDAVNPLRPGTPQLAYGDVSFRLGDKVMQLKNDYEKEVFNGDVGWVCDISEDDRELTVLYSDGTDERLVIYDQSELDALNLSYAISVHKSQGSEYPAVVMPVTFVAPALRTRNLLYTAITRAKKLVVLVGSKRALKAYISTKDESVRYSGLIYRLHAASL